jgi:hypothetical protein
VACFTNFDRKCKVEIKQFAQDAKLSRIGEILALRWRDVDFHSGAIRVEQACYRGLIGPPKTKGSRRTLPIPEPL